MNSSSSAQSNRTLTALGVCAWLGAVAVVQPGWAGALFLFAPLVAVPLAMAPWNLGGVLNWETCGAGVPPAPSRRDACTTIEGTTGIWPAAGGWRWMLFAAAWPMIPAYSLERGVLAAGLTLPWLLACASLAVVRLVHWRHRHEAPTVLMSGYLTVGCGWLLLARLGVRPLGFEDVIVHATAVHFHYAGLILPALLVRLAQTDRSPTMRLALVGVLAGVPLVAAGITLTVWQSHWLETVATLLLAAACWLAAWRQARFAVTVARRLPRTLLLISSASLTAAMVLASLYALGQLLGTSWLDIPFMLRFHGCLQVFGFALPALLAWRAIDAGVPRTAVDAGMVSPSAARLA